MGRDPTKCVFALPTEGYGPRTVDLVIPHDVEPQEWDIVDRYIRNYIALREDAGEVRT